MLLLDDFWIWDSWIADDGEQYHLFFLQAPKSLGTPDKRHKRATVGHATSTDLQDWTYHGTVLEPGAPGSWDDLAIWTGSVSRGDDGVWRMYYTAVSSAGEAAGTYDQRIGVVESDDLFSFHRVLEAPACEVDSRWYRTVDYSDRVTETWRDPQVFADPGGVGWHMLITARDKTGELLESGVIAHATSDDMIHWEVRPPLSAPGAGFSQLEVAQVREVDGQHIMAFTCHPDEQQEWRRAASGRACTWTLAVAGPLGPFDISQARPFRAEPELFAAPLVRRRDGSWCFVGFRNLEPEGHWHFHIFEPVPVEPRGDELVAVDGYPTFDLDVHLGGGAALPAVDPARSRAT